MPGVKKTSYAKWLQILLGFFLAISILAFVIAGASVRYQDLNDTYKMAGETASFVKMECQKFDNYTRGNSARSLQSLLDAADGLNQFIDESDIADSDFLYRFIRTEHIGGIVVFDSALTPIAQADMDHRDMTVLWTEVVSKNDVKNILQYPKKTYIDHITLDGTPYDMAAAAGGDGERLILCYASTEKPTADPYELSIESVLTNNSFYRNPTLVITDGAQVLSTNKDELDGTQFQQLAAAIEWKDDQLTKFEYQHGTYYGLRLVFNNYKIYAVYSAGDVFSHRADIITAAVMVYLGIGIVILFVQRRYDKFSMKRMEKQLRIINAISTAYNSTFLLHIDNMELEPIHPSRRLNAIFQNHQKPYDFLFAVCKTEVAAEFYPVVMHFLDLDTVAQRLKGKPFLGCEVKDCSGTWFSILLIPQKYDADGNVLAFLVTTRDITTVKQAEELSYKDKLTGLRNRNYMESRSKNFVREGDFPVSLIMVDCNYLKRTNDSMGHEYGDLLLQRIANAITGAIPKNCVAMRVGGDEFLVLCMQCSSEKAQQIVADIKKKLIAYSNDKLTLSAAFGISTVEESSAFVFERAYEAADRAMYQDKKAHRIER